MNNTTGSAIAMTLVPDEQRLDFWLNHFGSVKGWTTFEVVIFTTMGQFCDDYQGVLGILHLIQWWRFYLSRFTSRDTDAIQPA